MRQKLEQIVELLRTAIPELTRVEFEAGQTDADETLLPPVLTYPCAFVDISYPECSAADDETLQCGVEVAVRVAFRAWGGDGTSTSATFLAGLDLVDEVAAELNGWTDGSLCPLVLTSQTPESRIDGLKVYDLRFASSFEVQLPAKQKSEVELLTEKLMGYNRNGYIIRMKNIVDLTRQHYEPERQDRCYKMVWRKYINPQYGICYHTYLNYLRRADPTRRKYYDKL